MSTSYTSRFYKKETGENLQKYIVCAKIEKAKEMIRLNRSLKETIESVGFSSESHFFKVFKTVTGISPKQYRDKVAGKNHV
jgi:AraC-like DNA-binding protein